MPSDDGTARRAPPCHQLAASRWVHPWLPSGSRHHLPQLPWSGGTARRASLGPAAFAVLALTLLASFPAVAANALAGNASPYLAMHGGDPVDWRAWGPGALDEARQSSKPLFISSGYFACHWCHVMQRESYQNPAIADLLNRHFIPVKLDRELHPALDAHLIGFVERTAGHAGWPLNVFLTPEGYPLLGLTYAPPDEFRILLGRLRGAWEQQTEELSGLARRAAREHAAQMRAEDPTADRRMSPEQLAGKLRVQSLRYGDELGGGFGRQARFPMAPNLNALLALEGRAPDPEIAAFLRTTLDAMMNLGLRDHLGGGFFRYTVDPDWQTPHFEKMLYTQALLAPLYLRAAEVLGRPEYRPVARTTLDFMIGAMRGTNGGFIASLSAVDDQGIEGGYYLWRAEELGKLLDPAQRRLLALVWRLEGVPTHEAGLLPVKGLDLATAGEKLGIPLEEAERTMETARRALLQARGERRLPRDDKQLAGWNGLALSALCAGALAFNDDRYRRAARELGDFLARELWDGDALHRAASAAGWMGEATLEDYAFVAAGLHDLGRLTGSQTDLALSRRLVELAWELFHVDGGWRLAAKSLLPGVPPERVLAESPLPSPAVALMELSLASGDAALAERARSALFDAWEVVAANPFAFSGQALALLEHAPTP